MPFCTCPWKTSSKGRPPERPGQAGVGTHAPRSPTVITQRPALPVGNTLVARGSRAAAQAEAWSESVWILPRMSPRRERGARRGAHTDPSRGVISSSRGRGTTFRPHVCHVRMHVCACHTPTHMRAHWHVPHAHTTHSTNIHAHTQHTNMLTRVYHICIPTHSTCEHMNTACMCVLITPHPHAHQHTLQVHTPVACSCVHTQLTCVPT